MRRRFRPPLPRDPDLDRLEIGERLRFLISARDPCESTSEEEWRRRRSLTGLTELLGDLLRRRGGVRDRDRESLGAGELDLPSGLADRDVCLGNLLLSRLGDQDRSRRLADRGGDERRGRRGGVWERSYEGDRLRRRGGLRDRSDEGERRERRGGGEGERLAEGARRRSREASRLP